MRNTPLFVIGVLLVLAGAAGLYAGELSFGRRESVVEIGSVTVTADKKETTPIPPILGGIGMACGAVMIAVGARKK